MQMSDEYLGVQMTKQNTNKLERLFIRFCDSSSRIAAKPKLIPAFAAPESQTP